MKKLWNKYCKRVDYHNRYISYVNYEEYWDYETIFYPFIIALLITLSAWMITFCDFSKVIFCYIISFIFCSLMYLGFWISLEKYNKLMDQNNIEE